jgi:hypothetical protein
VFSELAAGPLPVERLAKAVGVHASRARDFFDALVAMGLLERNEVFYSNTDEVDYFLDRGKPSYIGGMAEMQSKRGYGMWGSLTDALRTGEPQSEAKGDFSLLYSDPQRARRYAQAMTGGSIGAAKAISRKFPWEKYGTFIDIGTAQGCLPVHVALAHPHLSGGGLDLPPAAELFEEYVTSFHLHDRLHFYPGDFVNDPLPGSDVLVMGNILCDFDLAQKRMLVTKAYEALPDGGALIVYDSIIDDERRENAPALLNSLGMLLQKRGAFCFTAAECRSWMEEAGFGWTSVEHLEGPRSMVIASKAPPLDGVRPDAAPASARQAS